MSKYLKPVFLLIGILLFLWAVWSVDPAEAAALVLKMGYGVAAVIIAYGLVAYCDALAWLYAFKPDEAAKLKVLDVLRIRTIGEAFNAITPLGSMGGEPVKAQLLKEHHGLRFRQGLASQVVARTTLTLSLILFLVPGTLFLYLRDGVSEGFRGSIALGMAVFTALILLFLMFQVTGMLSRIAGWFDRTFPSAAEPRRWVHFLVDLCDMMSGYYKNHTALCLKSIFYAWLGWVAGIVELWLTLHFLGVSLGWMDLWIIESILQLIRAGSFFIPLSLGAQEGGLILIFLSLGMGGPLGLAVSFARRIRELVWVGLGLVLGGTALFKPRAVPEENPES